MNYENDVAPHVYDKVGNCLWNLLLSKYKNIKLVFLWKVRATICLEWIIKWLFNFIKFLLLFDFFIKVFKIK